MTNETIEKNITHSIIPAVNIVESPSSYIVSLDIPGAVKEKINAAIENNSLLVTADVSVYSTAGKTGAAVQYHREFSLASDIDLNTIDAKYDSGVLTITLTKKQQYSPKQIAIN